MDIIDMLKGKNDNNMDFLKLLDDHHIHIDNKKKLHFNSSHTSIVEMSSGLVL